MIGLAALLASCATIPEPPAVGRTKAEAECRVMYGQAMIAARGYDDAQLAKTLFWDCVRAKGL